MKINASALLLLLATSGSAFVPSSLKQATFGVAKNSNNDNKNAIVSPIIGGRDRWSSRKWMSTTEAETYE